jgi:hypothetical protein
MELYRNHKILATKSVARNIPYPYIANKLIYLQVQNNRDPGIGFAFHYLSPLLQ